MTERTAGDFPISPTTDWGRDLDILDPRYVADPFGARSGRRLDPREFDETRGLAHVRPPPGGPRSSGWPGAPPRWPALV